MQQNPAHNESRNAAMLAVFYIATFVASFNEIIANIVIADIMGSFGI